MYNPGFSRITLGTSTGLEIDVCNCSDRQMVVIVAIMVEELEEVEERGYMKRELKVGVEGTQKATEEIILPRGEVQEKQLLYVLNISW